MKLDLIATTNEVRSLSRLRGRVGVGVSPRVTLPEWREPPPGASRRPPPQAGEVKRVCVGNMALMVGSAKPLAQHLFQNSPLDILVGQRSITPPPTVALHLRDCRDK